jgi:Flp pilus assembly protein TadD
MRYAFEIGVSLMKEYYSKIIFFAVLPILFLSAVAAHADAVTIKTNRFHSYIKQGIDKAFNLEMVSASALLKKAVALEPENPTGYAYLAMLHLFSYEMSYDLDARKKNQEAIGRYVSETLLRGEKRLETNSKDSEAYLAMALAKVAKVHWGLHEKRYLLMAQETSNIWNYLEKASAAEPNNFDIYFLMGILHYHIDQLPGLTRFASSLVITSGDSQKGLREIELAAQKGDLLQVIAQTELQAVYLIFEKQPAQALPVIRGLREKFPNNYNFLFAEANAFAELGRFGEAFAIARKIDKNIKLAKPPYVRQLQPRYDQLMGRIYFHQGEYDKATEYFQKALKDTAFYNARVRAWTLVRLGMIQDIREDRAGAQEYYSQALKTENGEGTAKVEARKYLQTPYVAVIKN